MQEILDSIFINIMILVAFTAIMGEVLKRDILYSGFGKSNKSKSFRTKTIITILMIMESLSLMHFNIHVDPRVSIDFRLIPIIIISMYIGVVPSVAAAITIKFLAVLMHGFQPEIGYNFVSMILIAILCEFIMKSRLSFSKKSMYIFLCVTIAINASTLILARDIVLLISIIPYITITTLILYIGVYKGINYICGSNNVLMKMKEEANRDFLTGLYNSRYFNSALEECSKDLMEKERVFSLIYLDIDNFKDINDQYGHGKGDHVIKEISYIISKTCRKLDVVSRIGGDEFTILLPNCPEEKAEEVAERIRKKISNHNFSALKDEIITVTASIGVKSCTNSQKSIEEIKEEVDKALYRAKKCGRNTVCTV